ncbi:MAG: hypothetical protein U9Q05_06725, partial [Thermodesulfobacteriota bacterium]|nr:hypothetical protein [Thermodesulfobacteriota bacterium]
VQHRIKTNTQYRTFTNQFCFFIFFHSIRLRRVRCSMFIFLRVRAGTGACPYKGYLSTVTR